MGVRNPTPKLQSLLSQERVKLRTSNLARTFAGSFRTQAHEKFWRNGSMGVSRDCRNFFSTPYYLRNGYKATNFKFRRCIHSVHANKSPLKIGEKRKRGRIQGLPNFFQYPLLSQERVKLRTSNFVCTFDRSQQKSITDFGKSSRSSQDSKFSRSPILGASRSRLCDSSAFL